MSRSRVRLSLPLIGAEPPTEFRLFTAGLVETAKGEFVFDGKAATEVMAEYETHGIDLAIDFEHASLAADCACDPAKAGKAAGWFNLELREGELWAVNVRWTPAASEALRSKEFRFYSPAFTTKGDRITSILNCALTNMPATRRLTPLVAASSAGESTMDTDLIKQALEALTSGDTKTCEELLTEFMDTAEAEPTDEEDADAETAEAPAPGAKKKKKGPDDGAVAPAAVAARLMRLTGTDSFVDAVSEVEALAKERQELMKERNAFESAERTRLCAQLVIAARKSPASVWADTLDPKMKGVPKTFLQKMSMAELRKYVADEIVDAGGRRPTFFGDLRPPRGNAYQLSDREIALCKKKGIEPAAYAKTRADILARKQPSDQG